MPRPVSRSKIPNSFSRSRSSTTSENRSRRNPAEDAMISAVCRARTYGEVRMTLGCASSGSAENHLPSARDCCSPSSDSGTSTSRVSMLIVWSPASTAASRATLPADWPWRTMYRRLGQICEEVTRGSGSSSVPMRKGGAIFSRRPFVRCRFPLSRG